MKGALPALMVGALSFGGAALGAEPPVPVAISEIKIPEIAPVSEAAIRAPLVVEKIKSGQISAEEAWQKGELTEEILLFLLNQEGGDRASLFQVDRSGLVKPLVEVLLRHLPQRVKEFQKLGAGVQLRLADYLRQTKDKRAYPIFENLLAQARAAAPDNLPWHFELAAKYHSEYLEDIGDWKSAAEVSLELVARSKKPFYQGSATLHAARLLWSLNYVKKAQALYDAVPKYGNGWATGLARADQAGLLMGDGKYQAAKSLLENFEGVSPEIKPFMLVKLGFLYQEVGDAAQSRRWFEDAVKHYEGLGKSQTNVNVERWVLKAKDALKQPNEVAATGK